MAYKDTIEKVLTVLKQLHVVLEHPKDFSLKSVLQFNSLAPEYGSMLLDRSYILRVGGGKRGRATYKWNPDIIPTEALAADLADSYAEIRKRQVDNRLGNTQVQNEKNDVFTVLKDIRQILSDTRDVLERIAENTDPKVTGIDYDVLLNEIKM
jgi:hypothetical protein